MTSFKHAYVWVLFRTGDEDGSVVLCGTAYTWDEAGQWSDSGETRGAIRLPLNGMAEGEEWR